VRAARMQPVRAAKARTASLLRAAAMRGMQARVG
jgi:hypothetical protein